MLTIRDAQMRAMQRAADEGFIERLIEYLHDEEASAVAGLGETELRDRTRLGLAEARRHGITWESSLAAFVALMFHAGPRFHRHARVQAILQDTRYVPDERMRRLWLLPDMEPIWQETRPSDPEAAWRSFDMASDPAEQSDAGKNQP
jgi:hypothetical protein